MYFRSAITIILAMIFFADISSIEAFAQTDQDLKEKIIGVDQKFVISTDSLITPEILSGIVKGVDLQNDPIVGVEITGRSSIDGPEEFNLKLASARAQKIREALMATYGIEPQKITLRTLGEDWGLFREQVTADLAVPCRDKVLEIIGSTATLSDKEVEIKSLCDGDTWRYLEREILPAQRSVSVAWTVLRPAAEVDEKLVAPSVVEPPVVIEPEPVEECEVVEEIIIEEPADEWKRKIYIKTNVPAWALLWQNLAVEIDLAPHWSFSVPVYWSPYNYGKQTLKFRTLAVVPEFRYWPKADNMGFFVNAHFGMANYNYAKNEEYRYQDHDGKTPALGGGLGFGYRFYFCKNHHWAMEAAVGGGVYRLDYDIFMNTPSTSHGYLVGRRKHTFFGIDQAAFSISYSFGL